MRLLAAYQLLFFFGRDLIATPNNSPSNTSAPPLKNHICSSLDLSDLICAA